jgi:hypothetical protein
MTAVLILVGIVVVTISTIILVAVPVRYMEAVAKDFRWRRSVQIGTRVWVNKRGKRQPKTSSDIRNVTVLNAGGAGNPRYTYEKRVWRNMRSVSISGRGQATVREPSYTLGRSEEVRSRHDSYEARFVSEEGGHYSAKIQFARWKLLKANARYRLGRNTFGRVRTIKPAKPPVGQRLPESARRAS